MQLPPVTRVVAVAVVLQLSAGLLATTVVREPTQPGAASAARARAVPQQSTSAADLRRAAESARADEVARLLAARSAALLGRDKAAFLATVDPLAGLLLERQTAMFDALAEVPLGSWDYTLERRSGRPADAALDVRYGRDQWWAPAVSLRHTLAGFDESPSVDEQHLTFVQRDGRWLLGADDDFEAIGGVTPRELWERGPVAVVRRPGVLAMGHRDSPLLRNVAALAADAIPRVTAIWGEQWTRNVVIVVPSDGAELASLLDSDGDFSQIAAVAAVEVTGDPAADTVAPDRVLVNPDTFSKLGQLGRRVVLTHEVTHVATRRTTGPAVPAWLAEGFADYVGYQDVPVPLSVSARELRRDVRAGRLPETLPADADFAGSNPALAQAYEQSWLAVRLLAETYGQDRLLRFYRALGASRGVAEPLALDTALGAEFGIDAARLTADWREALQRQLG